MFEFYLGTHWRKGSSWMSRYLMVSDDYDDDDDDDDDAHCDHSNGDFDDEINMTMTRLTTLYRAATNPPLCGPMMINDDSNDDDDDDQ